MSILTEKLIAKTSLNLIEVVIIQKNDSSESDAENEEMISFINDRKPLLLKKTKRKSDEKAFKSEVLFTGFDDDFEDHIVYEESLLKKGFTFY